MRALVVVLVLVVTVAACGGEPKPPVVDASEETPSESATATVDPDEAKLVELRATDQFDEFAEHERAAKADSARLAWENFAPIMDGKRVEWTNKAELWDSIAPKIRDEALLLGPEHRKPLWNTRNAIPASLAMAWTDSDTAGRGDYVEFRVAFEGARGAGEQVWGALVRRTPDGAGRVVRTMPPLQVLESGFPSSQAAFDYVQEQSWSWITSSEVGDAG